jgi:hypothetical protein
LSGKDGELGATDVGVGGSLVVEPLLVVAPVPVFPVVPVVPVSVPAVAGLALAPVALPAELVEGLGVVTTFPEPPPEPQAASTIRTATGRIDLIFIYADPPGGVYIVDELARQT